MIEDSGEDIEGFWKEYLTHKQKHLNQMEREDEKFEKVSKRRGWFGRH